MLLFFALVGCSGMNTAAMNACGGVNPCGWISPQGRYVSDHPDLGTIKDGYSEADTYYYSGSQALPTAVIRLNKEYALDDARWKPITDPQMFITLVENMKTKSADGDAPHLHAFTIKANDARPIGVWYSDKFVYGVRVSISADHKVYANMPNVENPSKTEKVIYVKNRSNNSALAEGPSICVRCHGAA